MERADDIGYKSQLDMTSKKIDTNVLNSFIGIPPFRLIGNRATDTRRY